jgi:cell shape-determining protein MreC
MKIKSKKATITLIVFSVVLILGTVAFLVYRRRKKMKTETVTQSVVSAVAGSVTVGYIPDSFPLRKGMHGERVRVLQAGLILQGFSVGTTGSDGKFGNKTLAAVREAFKNPNKSEVSEVEWQPYYSIYRVNNNLPEISI